MTSFHRRPGIEHQVDQAQLFFQRSFSGGGESAAQCSKHVFGDATWPQAARIDAGDRHLAGHQQLAPAIDPLFERAGRRRARRAVAPSP
jgi:hypothetical protein